MSFESLLALRGTKGIAFVSPQQELSDDYPRDENPSCRDMIFSKDGDLFSWCTNQKTQVMTKPNYSQTVLKIDDPRISALHFSPKGNYLSTWMHYSAKQNPQESCNLQIWDMKSGKCKKSFIQKKQNGWNPQWSDDEYICARNVSNEVHFYENSNFDTIAKKIFMQKVAYFSLAPGEAPYHVVCYVPGLKGQPSFVRLFRYPNFEGTNAVIAQKSFFKAERTDFYWNKTGKDCIILTSVDVDKSGLSYYGELNLYYVSIKGDTAKIKLGKDGPVYSVQWSPCSKEFCVIYGYMPAKATIYNLKCEPVFEFEGAPRNEVNYSPIGNRMALFGFGNLQGTIEVWDLKTKKQVSKFKAIDSTLLQWSPDGEYILTATTSPRLRIGNGYRIWHYTGSLLLEVFLPSNDELFDIRWLPVPEGTHKPKPTIFTPVPGIKSVVAEESKQVYRPPAALGKESKFKLHEEEEKANESASAALTKNQKKNMARKAKKALEKVENESCIVQPIEKSEPKNTTNSFSTELTGDLEKDKKIKGLLKKLDQIEKLKKDQMSGRVLEQNQLEKLKKAREFEEELSRLQLN